MRVVYEKTGPLRFIGHLDLQRTMQRALRRSDLPVRYSQGFNPHILLSFAAPLSVGMSGLQEVMETPLSEEISEAEYLQRLQAALPPGLMAHRARALPDEHPAAMAQVFAALYHIKPMAHEQALFSAVANLMQQASIPAVKRTKSGEKPYDLRPLVYHLTVKQGVLQATLALTQQGTARPDELLQVLSSKAGVTPPECEITRAGLLDQRFAPLQDA